MDIGSRLKISRSSWSRCKCNGQNQTSEDLAEVVRRGVLQEDCVLRARLTHFPTTTAIIRDNPGSMATPIGQPDHLHIPLSAPFFGVSHGDDPLALATSNSKVTSSTWIPIHFVPFLCLATCLFSRGALPRSCFCIRARVCCVSFQQYTAPSTSLPPSRFACSGHPTFAIWSHRSHHHDI